VPGVGWWDGGMAGMGWDGWDAGMGSGHANYLKLLKNKRKNTLI